ncbi:ABC transporter permease [bacterium]|nr:ABC transporter permease [bacterium]
MKQRFNWTVLFVQIGIVALFLAVWEMGTRIKALDPFYVSSPVRISKHIAVWFSEGILFKHLGVTLSEAAVGLIVGMVMGLVFGFLFAANRRIDTVLQPFIGVLNSLPRIAFAPLIILWFGLGFLSKVVIVVSLVFFVVFFNTYQGFKDVNPVLLKNARVLGASKLQIIQHIYLPATMTWIFASLRLSVGYAVIAAIIGEYIGASAGIGFLIDNAQAMFDSTGVMTGLVVLTLTVAVIDFIVRRIEKYFAKWKFNETSTGGIP